MNTLKEMYGYTRKGKDAKYYVIISIEEKISKSLELVWRREEKITRV